ncbi:RtcB family protein [Candidatus Woesearchaeota archaeon]|nr:RtcB family protein [Candidatus Woesearchaeota archaeon]
MKEKLQKVSEYEWLLPKSVRKEMNVAGKLIANKAIYDAMEDGAIEQLSNVCCLPGVIEPVCALPDAHFGYGLPMGAVAAFDAEEGIISSGLCGFDINCGINSIRTNLSYKEVKEKLKELVPALFDAVPCGVGSKGKLRLEEDELGQVLANGCEWAVEKGYGVKEDLSRIEENGRMEGADPSKISDMAKKRGKPQLGTLGAGNHFLEIQKVSDIYDDKAKEWGITEKDQVLIMLHCGSRGFGHQVASDYLKIQEQAVKKYKIHIPDRQLVCAPAGSKEGQDYFAAMKCAVNYSFTNRLVMTQWIRETFEKVFKKDWESMDMHTVYGICHNVVKLEEHTVEGKKRNLFVHRKGATRSFPDQPVLLAGSMGTASYILKGTETAMEKTFGSSAHGAGRAMSRHGALRQFNGTEIQKELAGQGIVSKSPSPKSLAEEAPKAYKDIENVVSSVHNPGISLKVVRMEPIGVLKG